MAGLEMEPTDEALLQACRRSDVIAWEQLIARYQRLVYTIPRRAGLGDELATNVFIVVFAQLIQHLEATTQLEQLDTWLITAAKRETLLALRQQRQSSSSQTNGEQKNNALEALSEANMTQIKQQHQIRRALETLDEPCQRLLALLFSQLILSPYVAINSVPETTPPEVTPACARCLEKLKQRLGELGFE